MKHSKMTVMLHPKNVDFQDLEELKDCGVELVRICISKIGYEDSKAIIDRAKQLGFTVSINITRTSQYSEDELDDIVSKVSSHDIDMIYFADSNGSMLPSEVKAIYKKYTKHYQIPFGFHAHD